MSKYMDILNEQWDKCLNLATYAFNISPSSDHSNGPYFLVFGKEPLDAELNELEELHEYTGLNCGFKRLQHIKNYLSKLQILCVIILLCVIVL